MATIDIPYGGICVMNSLAMLYTFWEAWSGLYFVSLDTALRAHTNLVVTWS